VQGVYLFDLAARQAQWLSVRQATIAENVANASTPGYRARDVVAFEQVLDRTELTLAATRPGHIRADAPEGRTIAEDGMKVTRSGNSVSLEGELIKAGEVNRDYALGATLTKAFHRMFMTALKG
jgi:flagellar basal-body rod protein FlgB